MEANTIKRFLGDENGAVAATYALALVPLVAFAGVAMDYARVMGMDSELQNGADQAALAAASQLDGRSGACERAANAASGMLQNYVVLSSDSQFVTVTAETGCDATGQIRFYQDKEKATPADADDNAKFVEVIVDGRSVDYYLLPITGLLTSPDIQGVAFAGLGSALCKVPPVMMCNPEEQFGSLGFDTETHAGKGLRLIANDSGGYVPGVFGYLETDAGSGASATRRVLGLTDPPGDCIATDGADVKPGVQVSVLDALNTRMGIYANGLNICGTDGVNCPASANSRIDLVKPNLGTNGGACAIGPQGFAVGGSPYRPNQAGVLPQGTNYAALDPMGYPRDKCHAWSKLGDCAFGRMGDGNWDRDAYYGSYKGYLGTKPSSWDSYGYEELEDRTEPTRYQQYRWEYEQGLTARQGALASGWVQGAPICGASSVAPASTPDRRVLSIAVINCVDEAVSASSTEAPILKFIDVFLVEPSAARGSGGNQLTEASDVYVEIIGETILGGGAEQGQEIRKDVPYLIE